jgi:RNA polymerase sigma-70 factor, ECF subfamily
MELLDLLLKAQKGNESAFTKLIMLINPLIREVAGKFFICPEMKEEAVQLCMLKIWKKLGAFDPNVGQSVRAWVYRVSRNCCLDLKRSEGRRKSYYIDDVFTYTNNEDEQVYVDILFEGKNPEELLADKELVRTFYCFMKEVLGDRQKAILYAMHIEGKSQKEVAEEFGITTTNVGAIVSRAIDKLRSKIRQFR